MTKTRLFLAVSLICNAILGAWAALPGSRPADPQASGSTPAESSSSGIAAWFAKLAPSPTPASSSASRSGSDAAYSESGWTRSLYDDVSELRERGFDEATVRMLALAEAERLFRERAQAVLAPRRQTEYWEPRRQWSRVEPAQLAIFQRLRREKVAAIAELVGPGAESTERNTPDTFMAAPLMTLDYLPVDKRLALSEYLETSEFEFAGTQGPFNRMRRATGNAANPAERELARDAQIRALLGPELHDEYLRRSSDVARRLRSELSAFRPTRAEFDALVAIEHDQRTQRIQMGVFSRGMSPDKMRMVTDQYDSSIRAALGEQRYADYESARDQSTVMLDRLVNELQLPPEAARASFEALQQARSKWQTLLSQASAQPNRAPDPRIQTELSAVQKQLREDLAASLGLEDMSETDLTALLAGVDPFEHLRFR
jgi:hypothetical protein